MKLPSQDKLIETYAGQRLDDVLSIQDPVLREAAVDAWVVGGSSAMDDSRVKLVTSDRKKMQTHLTLGNDKKKLTFDSNGRRVSRRVAVELLEKFGEGGIFRGVDPYSMYSPMTWAAFKVGNPPISEALVIAQKAIGNWPEGVPNFLLNYLTHELDGESAGAEAAA